MCDIVHPEVKTNHTINASYENIVGNQRLLDLRETYLVEHEVVRHKIIEAVCFWRDKYGMNTLGLKVVVLARPHIIRNLIPTHPSRVPANGLNIYKQLELWKTYRLHVSSKR